MYGGVESMSNEELVILYQQGDKQALESLIDNNGGIIRKISNKFYGINKMIEFDDLIQVGVIGLIAAAKKYDINMENKANFITYAFHYIKREIISCVNGRSSKDVENNKFNNNCVRLDTPLKEDNEIELKDTIESIDYGFENVEEKIYIGQLRAELETVMKENNTLKEREILMLHYGWDTNKEASYIDIADIFDTSANRIIQMEFSALKKLRHSNWGQVKEKEYINSKLEAIKESSRYNQDSVINELNIIDKYFSGVL